MRELVARCRDTQERTGYLGSKVTVTCAKDFHADLNDKASCRAAIDEIVDHEVKLGHKVSLLKELIP